MRQGDGEELLGSNDPRSASIGIIYVAPDDGRQSILTAILTQDKLGRKQVAVVLPERNRAFQRPVDFDGLKNMRRGLKTQIVFVAPGGPGPAEFARQRRFPVYSSLESFARSLRAEATTDVPTNGTSKRRLFGFRRKSQSPADAVMTSASSSRVEDVPTSPMPGKAPAAVSQQEAVPPKPGPDQEPVVADERNRSVAPNVAAIGIAASIGLGALASDQSAGSTLENTDANRPGQPSPVAGSQADQSTPSSDTPVQAGQQSKPVSPNDTQSKAGPEPTVITFPAPATRSRITGKFPVVTPENTALPVIAPVPAVQPNGSAATPPSRRGSTGKRTAVVAGVAGAGAGTAMAGRAAGGGGGLPPGGSNPGGPGGGGGGVGGPRRRTRLLLAILLVVLTLMLIGGIAAAAVPGGLGSITKVFPGAATTANVTITPTSKDLTNTYELFAVTGTPDPAKREVGARIISATSATQTKTAGATGSIAGVQATGQLTFLNTSASAKTFSSVVLTGASGVQVSFNGPVTVPAVPPASVTVTGFAVNVGAAGNIKALDIIGNCCAANITVKNGAFGGGRDPQPNSVIRQSDIDSAANALMASLTPGVQAALQKQIHANEQLVAGSFQCTKSTFTADHKAGDIAKMVTVKVAITCKEEVYDQQGALAMAANLLKMTASKDPGPAYALTGDIVTGVTKATLVDTTSGTVALLVRAEGVWVYQFSDTVKQGFANHIANMSKDNAVSYLLKQPGVSSVQIDISSGNTLPDAGNITIKIKLIPGATGTPTTLPGSPTAIPSGTSTPAGSPTAAPTGTLTPPAPVTPTPTQGLGG